MKNTKVFLLTLIALIASSIFFIVMVYNFIQFREITEAQVHERLMEQVKKEATILSYKIATIGKSAYDLSQLIGLQDDIETPFVDNFIQSRLNNENLLFGMGIWLEPYVFSMEDEYYGPYYYKAPQDTFEKTWVYSNSEYNYFEQNWYKDALNSNKSIVYSDLYFDEALETTFVTCSSPIIRQGEVIGVSTADITFREIRDYILNIEVGDQGYAYILTDEGLRWGLAGENDLAYNILNDNNLEMRELGNYILNSSQGEIRNMKSQKEFIAWSPIDATGLKLIVIYPVKECYEAINKVIIKNMIAFIVAIVLFILIINYALTKKIEQPMKEIIREIEKGKSSLEDFPISYQSIENIGSMIVLIKELFQERYEHVLELKRLLTEIDQNYILTVKSLSNVIEAKDNYTKGHCEKVTDYALKTADLMGLSEEDRKCLQYAAILHDIGKIAIPMEILNKSSKLTEEEYLLIKEHSRIGYEIIKEVPFLKRSALVILQHHERPDGKGYPQGLFCTETDILARIISVADAYDAMTRARPYRTIPLSKEAARKVLIECKETQFDEIIVDYFIQILD